MEPLCWAVTYPEGSAVAGERNKSVVPLLLFTAFHTNSVHSPASARGPHMLACRYA